MSDLHDSDFTRFVLAVLETSVADRPSHTPEFLEMSDTAGKVNICLDIRVS